MKKVNTLLAGVFFTSLLSAQTYNAPESVEFDYAHNRWLIANPGAGNILSRNSQNGALSIFASGSNSPHGLEIVNDTLYVCEGGTIHLFNLNNGTSITSISLGGTFLNGITHDNNGNLYATDFSAKKIYRLNTNTRQHNIFVNSGLTFSPNGIIFDQSNNRCVFVNWGTNAPIMSVNLADSTTAIITATTLSNNDGIAKDGAGNYYVSTWSGQKITRYTNSFTSPTVVVSTGLNNAADIFYNTLTDTLGVPNSATSGANSNTTKYYYFGPVVGIDESADNSASLSVSPNPVGERTEINYEINADGKVTIQLFDLKGQLVKTIAEENQAKGKHSVLLDKTGMAAGNYLLKLNNNNTEETKKISVK